MGTIILGDSMDQDFYNGIIEGIEPNTFYTALKSYIVDRGKFNRDVKRYCDEMCEIASEDRYMPYIAKLKLLLKEGLPSNKLQASFSKNLSTMDGEKLNYIMKAISRTTAYQKKLKAKQNFMNNGKQYQYIKDN